MHTLLRFTRRVSIIVSILSILLSLCNLVLVHDSLLEYPLIWIGNAIVPALLSIFISIALRNLCAELESDKLSTISMITDLKKEVEELRKETKEAASE